MAALLLASILTVALGVVHSIIGQALIFRAIRANAPALQAAGLRLRCVNILWATWHLATVFSWGMAAVLYRLSQSPPSDLGIYAARAIAIAVFAGGVLVLVGTKGRHPGWVVMLVIAVLTWVGVRI